MLSVAIPWGLTTALVKMDMREMEPTAQVSQKPRYQTMFSQLKNVSCQTNWCKLGCIRQEAQYWQRGNYRLNRRRHETSKIAGCSASELHSKVFGVLIVPFVFCFPPLFRESMVCCHLRGRKKDHKLWKWPKNYRRCGCKLWWTGLKHL